MSILSGVHCISIVQVAKWRTLFLPSLLWDLLSLLFALYFTCLFIAGPALIRGTIVCYQILVCRWPATWSLALIGPSTDWDSMVNVESSNRTTLTTFRGVKWDIWFLSHTSIQTTYYSYRFKHDIHCATYCRLDPGHQRWPLHKQAMQVFHTNFNQIKIDLNEVKISRSRLFVL